MLRERGLVRFDVPGPAPEPVQNRSYNGTGADREGCRSTRFPGGSASPYNVAASLALSPRRAPPETSMKPLPGIALLLAALSAASLPAASFDPEEHFPKECLYYTSVDVGALREGFRSTPFGRLLLHPGVEKAFEGARDKILEHIR